MSSKCKRFMSSRRRKGLLLPWIKALCQRCASPVNEAQVCRKKYQVLLIDFLAFFKCFMNCKVTLKNIRSARLGFFQKLDFFDLRMPDITIMAFLTYVKHAQSSTRKCICQGCASICQGRASTYVRQAQVDMSGTRKYL